MGLFMLCTTTKLNIMVQKTMVMDMKGMTMMPLADRLYITPFNLMSLHILATFFMLICKARGKAIKAPALDTYDIDYTIPAAINPMPHYELASVQSSAPPDARRLRPDKTPLYLSTQRLRI